jgi:ubiquinone/menaquinone biosynthesis C-methylase UbiE
MNFLKKIEKSIEDKYVEQSYYNENKPVLDFLSSLTGDISYLEVGSGLNRFPILLKEKFSQIDITCLEINKDLAEKSRLSGFKTVNKDFLENDFPSDSYDVVHCSHVIEHLSYPSIVNFLDELVRITKVNGYIIIRSPLMHPRFYLDIDHVRPYPPNCIVNYFTNSQQQRVGQYKIKTILIWLRREMVSVNIRYIDILLKWFWNNFKFPMSKANAYVLILQKINE